MLKIIVIMCSSITPEKENRPRTPKLLLKRMPSSNMANSPLASKWKVRSIMKRMTMLLNLLNMWVGDEFDIIDEHCRTCLKFNQMLRQRRSSPQQRG